MSKTTRAIIWIGVAVIVIMCLFPPWLYVPVHPDTNLPAGRHFILRPPKRRYDEQVVRLDKGLLLIQCGAVALLATGLIFVLPCIMAGPKDHDEE
ncbi:MAG: hypothetical protein ACYTEL_23670 [Planctomycetota bacterium]|jgi:hypothetical protein